MIRVLVSAALLLAVAGTAPASARTGCWVCCGIGQGSDGQCQQMCDATCTSNPQRVMRTNSQCAPQYRVLTCNLPNCKWSCTSAK